MKDNRYIELKKENDNTLSHLSPSYNHIGSIYVKKARGYAVKSVDTELKIKDVLVKLEDLDMRNVQYNIAIPNETDFVESNIKLLSKQVKDPDRIKSIIGISVLLLAIALWFAISIWMRQDTPNQTPQNVKCEQTSIMSITVTWDENKYATEGYYVKIKDANGVEKGYFHTIETSYTFNNLNKGESYTFYVKTVETELFAESKDAVITFKLGE